MLLRPTRPGMYSLPSRERTHRASVSRLAICRTKVTLSLPSLSIAHPEVCAQHCQHRYACQPRYLCSLLLCCHILVPAYATQAARVSMTKHNLTASSSLLHLLWCECGVQDVANGVQRAIVHFISLGQAVHAPIRQLHEHVVPCLQRMREGMRLLPSTLR